MAGSINLRSPEAPLITFHASGDWNVLLLIRTAKPQHVHLLKTQSGSTGNPMTLGRFQQTTIYSRHSEGQQHADHAGDPTVWWIRSREVVKTEGGRGRPQGRDTEGAREGEKLSSLHNHTSRPWAYDPFPSWFCRACTNLKQFLSWHSLKWTLGGLDEINVSSFIHPMKQNTNFCMWTLKTC